MKVETNEHDKFRDKTSIRVHKNQSQKCINTQLNAVIQIQVLGYFKSLVG